MVNFRFHLVSLVAVFLALGIGIIVGSTVIDQATVQGLERNIDTLEDQRDRARRERAATGAELEEWERLASELPGETVAGRLADVPVLVVAVEGVDRGIADRVHAWLTAAGAADQGTLWLAPSLAADDEEQRRALAAIVGSSATRAASVERAAVDALADALTPPLAAGGGAAPRVTTPEGAAGPPVLAALRDAGFVTFDAPEGLEVEALPAPGTRYVVLSGTGARLADADVAVPLVRLLAARMPSMIVAGEAAPDDDGAVFVPAVRDDHGLRRTVSTVDHLDEPFGPLALVFALEDLAGGAIGHFGTGVERLLPPPNR